MITNSSTPVTWLVRPVEQQKIVKRCPGCESKRSFVSSGAFRVNAHKKTIDVWHIYKCERCEYTWNIDIVTRTNRKSIESERYELFLQNDPDLSRDLSFDYAVLSKNKAQLDTFPDFEVEGDPQNALNDAGWLEFVLKLEFPIPYKLAQILMKKFNLSRRRLTSLIEHQMIRGITVEDLTKKMKSEVIVSINAAALLSEREQQEKSDQDIAEAAERRRISNAAIREGAEQSRIRFTKQRKRN